MIHGSWLFCCLMLDSMPIALQTVRNLVVSKFSLCDLYRYIPIALNLPLSHPRLSQWAGIIQGLQLLRS